MDNQPLSFKDHFTQVIGDMASAVCQRPGETHEKQVIRSKIAIQTVLDLRPRDSIEALLAGHCMMYHELIVDSVRHTLRGEVDTISDDTRDIAALDRIFGENLAVLERYLTRPSEGVREATTDQRTTGQNAEPAPYVPSAEAIERCYTNPEAIAALEAGDAAGFARALGFEPTEAYMSAASKPGGRFDRTAWWWPLKLDGDAKVSPADEKPDNEISG
jgi:hypothetical protein